MGRLRILEVGAEPADLAGGFFAAASGIEGDEAVEQGIGGGWRGGPIQVGPAVGGEDGGVEFVVELAEDGDEAGFMLGFVLGGQRLAAAQFGQHVVHAR
ncbi:MAG: hypothetical protein Q8N89_17625 [Azonexus sp.]|nr:hypothetical protein [Azonexus sp.]